MTVLAAVVLLVWLGLWLVWGLRGSARQWLDAELETVQGTSSGSPDLESWPEVVAVIPARDEAEVIARTIEAHGKTRYPGRFQIVLVDDASSDATAAVAREAAAQSAREAKKEGRPVRVLHVVSAPPLAEGWTGKIAAQKAGLDIASRIASGARYVLLTDADIVHGPDVLEWLVAKAERDRLALVSLMARLDARGVWGGLLVPAFVFFFQKLYPFSQINAKGSRIAGAAGGCMLVRRTALEEEGGIGAIRDALIDDCALGALLKGTRGGGRPRRAIWLGLTRAVVSLRDNRRLESIWTMVARTAYAQLGYSPVLLVAALAGMVFTYWTAPLLALGLPIHGNGPAAVLAALAWTVMALSYAPTLRVYDRPWWQAFALPVAALLYTVMTWSSAWRSWAGRGGQWKGRTYPAGQ